jgi:hypothetical protein
VHTIFEDVDTNLNVNYEVVELPPPAPGVFFFLGIWGLIYRWRNTRIDVTVITRKNDTFVQNYLVHMMGWWALHKQRKTNASNIKIPSLWILLAFTTGFPGCSHGGSSRLD